MNQCCLCGDKKEIHQLISGMCPRCEKFHADGFLEQEDLVGLPQDKQEVKMKNYLDALRTDWNRRTRKAIAEIVEIVEIVEKHRKGEKIEKVVV